MWRGLGFLPAKERGFFLDSWSRTSVASIGTEVFQVPSLWVQGRHGEAVGKSRRGRQRGSLGELTAPCVSRLQSPSCLPPSPGQSSLGGLWTPKPLAPAWPIVPFHRLLGGPCPGPLIQRPDRGRWEHQARAGPLGWESRAHRPWSPAASWWGLR